jgi:sorbitol/mannitol transport system substrate-binding protein
MRAFVKIKSTFLEEAMRFRNIALLSVAGLVAGTSYAFAQGQTLTIATVNNADMIIMQRLSPKWEQATGNKLNWVVLEENVLRQRATTDIATKGGQFDIITIGSYETPIWGKQNWLVSLDDLGNDYDYGDLIPTVKSALSSNGKLYAVPFYAESSFTFYRKDLFDHAGIKMPDKPTYDQIAEYAAKLTDKSKEQYGFCQRGKPGWGENMAFIGPMVNAFGGRWFNEKWEPQLTTEPWKNAINYYVKNMREYGPPGATANGHNENRALFATGHCAMWVDATSAAGYIYNPKESQVADKTAFAPAPVQVTSNGSAWFWSWALAIPASSKKVDAAKSFLKWATSKDYIAMVGNEVGWVSVPPGTRKSTYDNPEYQKAAPFAKIVYDSVVNADITKPTKDPAPYVGIQYVAIPEFQGIGTAVGQQIAAALAGQATVDQALENAQRSTERTMKQAGYPK